MDIKNKKETDLLKHYEKHTMYNSSVDRINLEEYIKSFELALGEDSFMLDVGCGDGRVINKILNVFKCKGVGIDYSPKRIEIAKNKCKDKKANFFVEDLNQFLEENDKQFDLVTVFEVIEHLENPKKVIEQIKKSLSEKGTILGSVPLNDHGVSHITIFKDIDDVESSLGVEVIKQVERFAFFIFRK